MSGLSINFEKSSLIPVNCEPDWVQRMCSVLGCKAAVLPVKYLGVNLGANPWLLKTWKPVIDKVEEKLSLWKAKVLNKTDKLVLIKSILNSLPVYYLSLYKMPKAVVEKLITLQRIFLWGKEDGKPGIAQVKWEVVQAPKKVLQEERLPEDISSYSFTKAIWKGLVPPRVEVFTWFVLIGRVNTKDRLSRSGVIESSDNLCVLCGKDIESVYHLFVACEFLWQL
ncbi:uncharacterized protein LOC107633533 [Arachis ipaensis]|uniref:uncharacterized protein LOC107633533 n=1 Tax=Arachis ipaensis TaxID=130454 RepID=UPI0007AFC6E7|nr:uncharacterized protein LOC107633533 [Arachis ipaensis]XP_025640638.1 uncharacterized protein LOC112735302 [Arachis hypogaea]